MGLHAIELSTVETYQLYMLARVRKCSINRVMADLIHDASRALTIEQWIASAALDEAGQAAVQEDRPVWGLIRPAGDADHGTQP